MLTIRLSRFGKRKKPFYRVVVIESSRARNGRVVEAVGTYDPLKEARGNQAGFRACEVLARFGRSAERHRAQLYPSAKNRLILNHSRRAV